MDREELTALQLTKDELLAKFNGGHAADVATQRPAGADSGTPAIVFEPSRTSIFVEVRIAGTALSAAEASLTVK